MRTRAPVSGEQGGGKGVLSLVKDSSDRINLHSLLNGSMDDVVEVVQASFALANGQPITDR